LSRHSPNLDILPVDRESAYREDREKSNRGCGLDKKKAGRNPAFS
jgi:hypothetical protein